MPHEISDDGVDLAAEQFHLDAVMLHRHRLVDLLREDPTGISLTLLVCVYDLLAWSVRLREDVRNVRPPRVGKTDEPVRNRVDHVAVGAKWARDQIVHGRGHRVLAPRSTAVDDSFDSADVLVDDPEIGFDGALQHTTIRLVRVDHAVGDAELRRYYNACVANRRVVVVAGLLTGTGTLG